MPFNRPTLPELINTALADLLSRLGVDDALRRADAQVQARVLAGGLTGLYGYISWVAQQIIPDTAEAEYLDRWANIWGVPRKPASASTGSVSFTVQAGAVVPSGTILQALDGARYATTTDASGTAPTYTAPVQAVVAGAAGNRSTGQVLALISPIAGVQATAVAGALDGGADIETDDALRQRLITRISNPPQGGSSADYVEWALSVAGVTRAWCYPEELGPGTVTVRFMRDNDLTAIPDAGEVATVQAYIDNLRPVTAHVTVVAPISSAVNFTISLSPDTPANRAAVQAELTDLLLREAVPGGTILLSHIQAAISAASGENDHTLTVPSANVAMSTGYIATMGAITWV